MPIAESGLVTNKDKHVGNNPGDTGLVEDGMAGASDQAAGMNTSTVQCQASGDDRQLNVGV